MIAAALHLSAGQFCIGVLLLVAIFALAVGARHTGDDDFNP